MFTGIIQKTGRVTKVDRPSGHGTILVETEPWPQPYDKGESIAVEGVCLTLTGWDANQLRFDLLNETFERTNLGQKRPGHRVNLERSLRAGDAIGGHFVTGHVDGVGRARSIRAIGRDHVVEVSCDGALLQGMVPKGSIALNGISLTIVDLLADAFTVHIIPHTWDVTSLRDVAPGSVVNLETDMLGKYVKRVLQAGASPSGITWEKLRASGLDSGM
jgi:riboflavin synthase